MRQKRAKTYKRVMALYTQTFGFRQPFQVLVSQDLLIEGGKSDLNMNKQFLQVTQGECKPMITQCCMEALYKLGKDVQQTTNLAKTFERRKCNHRTALEPDECLKDVIGATNKHRYVLASQSSALRTNLQPIPGLPIIHFNPRGVLVLSPPSTSTIREKNKLEEARRLEGAKELEGVVDGGNVVGASGSNGLGAGLVAAGGRTRKVKGVNPLSAKKKKTKAAPSTSAPSDGNGDEQTDVGKKRRRDDETVVRREEESDVEEGDDAGDNDAAGKRKRRRKKKKSAVGEAIADLNAEAEGRARLDDGGLDGGSGSDTE
ncbi:hypothetical protein CI109_105377 [Kwoniella shandongensis]|uniref:U three protein 23 n=1 Tax=Kwoniella shandongensis TaxID=1734106 RepID=A0A5M6BR23_9TREE|nr:uncharacterized protein CI109_006325 [Kwoniella shandongensis]KAA5525346.1 hypothetical protein CI109_006325 [Kwoniella shandongensis]